MHAISSYRGNRPTHRHKHSPTHIQDRLQYTASHLARSIKRACIVLHTDLRYLDYSVCLSRSGFCCNRNIDTCKHHHQQQRINTQVLFSLKEHEGPLPQTDRASAFVSQKFLARAGGVVDPVKIFPVVRSPCKI